MIGFALHRRRMAPLLNRLRGRGLAEPNVLDLLTVESYYRPLPARLAEYAAWAASPLTGRPVEKLSVGRAQVQLRHWRALGLLDDTRFSLRRLAIVMDLNTNYEACRRYLVQRDALHERDALRLARTYCGGPRRRYVTMLQASRG